MHQHHPSAAIQPNLSGPIQQNLHGAIQPNLSGAILPNLSGAIQPNLSGAIQPNLHGAIQPNLSGAIQPNPTAIQNHAVYSGASGSINTGSSGVNPNLGVSGAAPCQRFGLPSLYLSSSSTSTTPPLHTHTSRYKDEKGVNIQREYKSSYKGKKVKKKRVNK